MSSVCGMLLLELYDNRVKHSNGFIYKFSIGSKQRSDTPTSYTHSTVGTSRTMKLVRSVSSILVFPVTLMRLWVRLVCLYIYWIQLCVKSYDWGIQLNILEVCNEANFSLMYNWVELGIVAMVFAADNTYAFPVCFSPFYRTEQLIIRPNKTMYPDFAHPNEYPASDTTQTGGAFQKEFLRQVCDTCETWPCNVNLVVLIF